MTDDPWKVLCLQPDAPADVIEAVYLAMRRRIHPDAGGSVAEFQRIQGAYETLTDPALRGRLELGRANAEQALDHIGGARVAACVLLKGILDQLEDQDQLAQADVVQATRDLAARNIEEKRAAHTAAHRNIAKYTRARRGVRRRKGSDNVLGNFLDSEIAKLRKSLGGLEAETKFALAMYDVLGEYSFMDEGE